MSRRKANKSRRRGSRVSGPSGESAAGDGGGVEAQVGRTEEADQVNMHDDGGGWAKIVAIFAAAIVVFAIVSSESTFDNNLFIILCKWLLLHLMVFIVGCDDGVFVNQTHHLNQEPPKTKMPILFTVIARGTTVLAKHAACAGNFSEVIEQILAKIPPENSKLTYTHSSYLFSYVKENNITYLCITDDDFERRKTFLYLADIKNRFELTYGLARIYDALPYGMNSDFSSLLANEMKRYSESKEVDAMSRVENQLGELKDIMVKNIDDIASRGERLELLVNKAENLNATSVSFQKTSSSLARAMYWRNVKFYVLASLVVLLVIYIIVSISCGGLGWGNCVGGSSNSSSSP